MLSILIIQKFEVSVCSALLWILHQQRPKQYKSRNQNYKNTIIRSLKFQFAVHSCGACIDAGQSNLPGLTGNNRGNWTIIGIDPVCPHFDLRKA